MNDEINYKNNPLHSIGLKKLLVELTDHYGFEILFAYLNINCFKTNPSIASSVKFLKKTDWAREKVEGFYLYSFKNLPKATYEQYQLPPRDRIIPDDQTIGVPAVLTLEDAQQLREKRELRSAEFESNSRAGAGAGKNNNAEQSSRRSGNQKNNNTSKDKNHSPASSKRTASTALNPWGTPKSE